MSSTHEIPADAMRRRRRRAATVLALVSTVLGSAFVADRFLSGNGEETAWTSDTVFPKLGHYLAKPHGVTVPISRRVVHKGQGGPEEPGEYIKEANDGWLLTDGQKPIDGFARTGFSLPGHPPYGGGGFRFAPGGFAPGGGGGSDGGLVLSCPDDAAAIAALGRDCPEAGADPDSPEADEAPDKGGLTILPVVSSPGAFGSEGNGATGPGGTGGTNSSETDGYTPPPETPVTAVPEPQNWAMLIAGFFLAGMAIRSGRTRMRQAGIARR
jgi:hypothetical protein